jgi:hypothetical protein
MILCRCIALLFKKCNTFYQFLNHVLKKVGRASSGNLGKCHKFILALKSNIFKAMLYTTECTEKITGTIRIEDFDAKTMNTMFKYMYQNKITYEEATDLNLIVAANKYNITAI